MPDTPRPLRLFIAVPTAAEVRSAAERVLRGLRGRGDVRWVTPERLHLTLKFLGETPGDRVPEIIAALEKSSNKFSPLVVELEGVGAFPNLRKPQTIWLGIGRGERLAGLAESVESALQNLGFEREKRAFRPHLTLGRLRSPKEVRELTQALEAVQADAVGLVEWPVTEVQLVQSVLRPSGPEYTVLHTFPLARVSGPEEREPHA